MSVHSFTPHLGRKFDAWPRIPRNWTTGSGSALATITISLYLQVRYNNTKTVHKSYSELPTDLAATMVRLGILSARGTRRGDSADPTISALIAPRRHVCTPLQSFLNSGNHYNRTCDVFLFFAFQERTVRRAASVSKTALSMMS